MRPLFLALSLSLLATATQAADGCGPGFHATPRGICRPNGERVVVVEPRRVVVERPVIVEPRRVVVERPVVVARPVVVERPRVIVARPTCGVRVGPIAVRGAC